MSHDPNFIEEVREYVLRFGISPLMRYMILTSRPLTREMYISLKWPDGMPDHPGAELEIPPYLTNEPLDPMILYPFSGSTSPTFFNLPDETGDTTGSNGPARTGADVPSGGDPRTGIIELHHWSQRERVVALNPAKYGTAFSGSKGLQLDAEEVVISGDLRRV